MNANLNRDAKACSASLEGEMTIYTAAQLKPVLLALLDECHAAELDLSQVAEIDTAGMQLLLLAKREAARAGKELRLVGHSAAVVDALDLCNLTADFGDQVILTSQN